MIWVVGLEEEDSEGSKEEVWAEVEEGRWLGLVVVVVVVVLGLKEAREALIKEGEKTGEERAMSKVVGSDV